MLGQSIIYHPSTEVWGKVLLSEASLIHSVCPGGVSRRGVVDNVLDPDVDTPPLIETATEDCGTHTTGMHSCYLSRQ